MKVSPKLITDPHPHDRWGKKGKGKEKKRRLKKRSYSPSISLERLCLEDTVLQSGSSGTSLNEEKGRACYISSGKKGHNRLMFPSHLGNLEREGTRMH